MSNIPVKVKMMKEKNPLSNANAIKKKGKGYPKGCLKE